MKNRLASCLFSLLILSSGKSLSQSLPAGTPVLEDYMRRKQIKGEIGSDISFTVRPLYVTPGLQYDSLYATKNILPISKKSFQLNFANDKGLFRMLPLSFKQQHNSHHAYGWNDGSMVPANGYQSLLSFGVFTKFGPVTVQLQPELVYAQNRGFKTFPDSHNDTIWKNYYAAFLNTIDNPEHFGNKPFAKLFPGQSSIRFNFKKLSVGISSENLWWGPGLRNSLLMSNNAPGFPHLTLNTSAPLQSPVGSFEGQLVSGILKKSGFISADTNRTYNGRRLFEPKPEGDRYLNGITINWQPKWTKGLYLGFSRVFYLYRFNVEHSINGYLPVVGQLFKGNLSEAEQEDKMKRDQLLSFFFRLILPKEKAEIYAEFGRNDHSGNTRDLLMEPEHSSAFLIGFRKIFETSKKTDVELMAELTNLQKPSTLLIRAQESWYSHYQVRDGYTHKGQVIGAGIGPGGNSQTIGVNVIKELHKTGVVLERVVHNNDFYYTAFTPEQDYWRHWVDLSIQVNKSFQYKNLLMDARISWVKSLNYQWVRESDVHNLQPSLSVFYLF
ncbi:MAG: hypothetical protein EOO10_03960 [Chitinophagaceae bacterium]|nr:MAG: hypothetical protein EOO10_03960 [Chitinophagaceae bacterium]